MPYGTEATLSVFGLFVNGLPVSASLVELCLHYTNVLSPLSPPVLKIGFNPDRLVFNESAGVVSVCAVILSPIDLLPSPTALVVFSIFAVPGTAQSEPLPPAAETETLNSPSPPPSNPDPDDFMARTREEAEANRAQSGLSLSNREACTSIAIINDTEVGEGPETLQLDFAIEPSFTNVNVEGCPVNITILDRRMFNMHSLTER